MTVERRPSSAWLVLLVACTGAPDADSVATSVDSPTCAIRLVESMPADGATDVYFRGTVEFELAETDPLATIRVDGVEGEVSLGGSRDQVVVFTPSSPLAPLTSYTATLAWCGGEASIGFTTSEAGLPLEDEAALLGRVYAVPFRSGRIVEPAGAAGVLGQYLTQTDLLRIDAVGDGAITVTNGLAIDRSDPPVQDWCVPTETFPEASFAESPSFTLAADGIRMVVAGYVVDIHDLTVSGTFSPDGATIVGGQVRYAMDMRALAPIVDADDPGAICTAAEQFGEACEPCPGSGEPYCLRFHLDQLVGGLAEGLSMQDVGGVNCPDCATTPPGLEATCD